MPNDEPAVPPAPQSPTSRIWLKELPYVWGVLITLHFSAWALHEFYEATDDRLLENFLCLLTGVVLYLERLGATRTIKRFNSA